MKPKIFVAGLVGMSVFMRVDHFNKKGETVICEEFYKEPGGKGFNQATAAKRMGCDVVFAYATGDDSDGDICEEVLKKEGIYSIRIKKKSATSYADILVDKMGENRVCEYLGASGDFTEEDVNETEKYIKDCDLMLLQLELSVKTIKAFINLGKKYNKKIILNPAPAKELPDDFFDGIYMITPNEQEYEIYKDKKLNCKIIVTKGEKGAVFINENKIIPASKVKALDTTGAGDTFNGTLASFIAKGFDIIKATQYAVKASGISVTKKYVLNSIPYERDILTE